MNEKRLNKRTDLDGRVALHLISGSHVQDASASIINVSRDGVGFLTDTQLLIGECYQTKITLWTKQTVDCILKIVRAEQQEDGLYNYGAIFVGMVNSEAMRILIYQMFDEEN